MQTSAPTLDLMPFAAHALEQNHRVERELLDHRADEFAAIAQVIAGLPVQVDSISLHRVQRTRAADGSGYLSNDVIVVGQALEVDAEHMHQVIEAAGLKLYGTYAERGALYEHPAERWMLMIDWIALPAVAEAVNA